MVMGVIFQQGSKLSKIPSPLPISIFLGCSCSFISLVVHHSQILFTLITRTSKGTLKFFSCPCGWVMEMNEKRYLNNNNNYTIKKIARSVEAIDFG
jgi:hypothetical protein